MGGISEEALSASGLNISLVTPQMDASGSTLYGYHISDPDGMRAHLERSLLGKPEEMQAKMARIACHFLVDLTPMSGLEELLEKTVEIREYYSSLQDRSTAPALGQNEFVPMHPDIVSTVREPFIYVEG